MESALSHVIEKISSYEIFNNIIPGVIYSVFTEKLTKFRINTENIFINMVLLYFVGLVISRIGSIFSDIIGWCFSKLGWSSFLRFANYSDYIQIENIDTKDRIRNLVIVSNMYRAFASLFVCLILTIIVDSVWSVISADNCYKTLVFIMFFALLAILFVFSYRKQTNYITERINFTALVSDTQNSVGEMKGLKLK